MVLKNIIQVCFLRPKVRPYQTNNVYAVLERQNNLDWEVYRIVHGKYEAVPRRAQGDQGTNRQSQRNGYSVIWQKCHSRKFTVCVRLSKNGRYEKPWSVIGTSQRTGL